MRTNNPKYVALVLKELWYAAELNRSNVIKLPTNEHVIEQRAAFEELNKSLLGDDAISLEVET